MNSQPEVQFDAIADRAKISQSLGIIIEEKLLDLALTHRSYSFEHGAPNNERLELLGDAVLELVITEKLYRKFPERTEGQLAKMRSNIVNTIALAEISRNLDLGAYLALGRGEVLTGGRDKNSLLADVLEAILGAVYLQGGYPEAFNVISVLFDTSIQKASTKGASLDWKTSIQEYFASQGLPAPHYEVTSTGPDHNKEFTASIVVNNNSYGQGIGKSKKQAEQRAAEAAWQIFHPDETETDTDLSQDESAGINA